MWAFSRVRSDLQLRREFRAIFGRAAFRPPHGLARDYCKRRCGDWCDLPFRITHERIGELIGSTRVTSTRLISKLRRQAQLATPDGQPSLRLAAALIEAAPVLG